MATVDNEAKLRRSTRAAAQTAQIVNAEMRNTGRPSREASNVLKSHGGSTSRATPATKFSATKHQMTTRRRGKAPIGIKLAESLQACNDIQQRLDDWRASVSETTFIEPEAGLTPPAILLSFEPYDRKERQLQANLKAKFSIDNRFIHHLSHLFAIMSTTQEFSIQGRLQTSEAYMIACALPNAISELLELSKSWSPTFVAHTWAIRALITWSNCFHSLALSARRPLDKTDACGDLQNPYQNASGLQRIHTLYSLVDEHLLNSARAIWRHNKYAVTFDTYLEPIKESKFQERTHVPAGGCTGRAYNRVRTSLNFPRTLGFMYDAGAVARRGALARVSLGLPVELKAMIEKICQSDRSLSSWAIEVRRLSTEPIVHTTGELRSDMSGKTLYETYGPWPMIDMPAECRYEACQYNAQRAKSPKQKESQVRPHTSNETSITDVISSITCPRRMRVRWNMETRDFEIVHINSRRANASVKTYKLCKQGLKCRGHHPLEGQTSKDTELLENFDIGTPYLDRAARCDLNMIKGDRRQKIVQRAGGGLVALDYLHFGQVILIERSRNYD